MGDPASRGPRGSSRRHRQTSGWGRRTALVLAVLGFLAASASVVATVTGSTPEAPADAAESSGVPTLPAGPAPAFPAPGSVAPGFALPLLRTEAPWVGPDTVRLSDLRGRRVYLDVFGSWCPPCRRKYPAMTEIARELEAGGVAVIGLLLQDRPRAAADWLKANGGLAYPFLVLDDETARAWGITGAPMGFLVSPEGRLERMCYTGARGEPTRSSG